MEYSWCMHNVQCFTRSLVFVVRFHILLSLWSYIYGWHYSCWSFYFLPTIIHLYFSTVVSWGWLLILVLFLAGKMWICECDQMEGCHMWGVYEVKVQGRTSPSLFFFLFSQSHTLIGLLLSIMLFYFEQRCPKILFWMV